MCENHKNTSGHHTVAPKISFNALEYKNIDGYQILFNENADNKGIQSLIEKTNDTVKNMLAGKKENFKFLSLPAILGDTHEILKPNVTNDTLFTFVETVNNIVS